MPPTEYVKQGTPMSAVLLSELDVPLETKQGCCCNDVRPSQSSATLPASPIKKQAEQAAHYVGL